MANKRIETSETLDGINADVSKKTKVQKLILVGKPSYVYKVQVQDEEQILSPGTEIEVETKEEVDRLVSMHDVDGRPLFKFKGGNQ